MTKIKNSDLKTILQQQARFFLSKEKTWSKRLVNFALKHKPSWDISEYVDHLYAKFFVDRLFAIPD